MINYQIGKLYKLAATNSFYRHSSDGLLYDYEYMMTKNDIVLLIGLIDHGEYRHFKILTDKGTIGWIWSDNLSKMPFDIPLEITND